MSSPVCVRHADLGDLVALLNEQQAAKVDVVAPASAIHSRDGHVELLGVPPVIDERGVTAVDGRYSPTCAADGQIAAKLDIPGRYLRRLRDSDRLDLYDANVNGLLHAPREAPSEPDTRQFLLRLFTRPGQPGVLRAFLSDRYGIIDNLDVLTAVLDGIRSADADATVRACDLSESSMHCKVYSPRVRALAPNFLSGYRNPFANPALEAERRRAAAQLDAWRPIAHREGRGYSPGSEPVVFAGFRFSNSETGHHALCLTPELVVQVCGNGLTLPMFTHSRKHIGERIEAGAIGWSQDTYRKRLAVITAETRDRVSEWLSPEFLAERVDELEHQAGQPVTQPEQTLAALAPRLGFTDTERAGILTHFIAGGQLTAAGVANAVTSYSQTVPDPDRAAVLDDLALRAMALV
ncbi:hypothetical protein D5S18_08195 [Nocardia panacis]|uniref:DUF932 domain-containing protein n=1 Tax=Nocardia panacis TaxID=2340916 RepID=A0A3A4L5B2_9NOCA|nr:hypothetical protein [Nocardia panacis]RJO77701.1 hypothetical protein D5S18_08195 [Nocardia panacis]